MGQGFHDACWLLCLAAPKGGATEGAWANGCAEQEASLAGVKGHGASHTAGIGARSAEAVAQEPNVVIGPVTDKLLRFRPIGWYGVLGFSLYRQAALYRIENGSSISA